MNAKINKGVLLLNLGGPEKQEDIRPFLFNLFSDRKIIRLGPWFMQKPIAWMIARKRAPKSAANYKHIGGGSPLRKITDQQAASLEKALHPDGRFIVRTCMRYWHPRAETVLREMQDLGVQELIALPLYPHYSVATTGSSVSDLKQTAGRLNPGLPIREIGSWPKQPDYIDALVGKIRKAMERFKGEPFQVLYSAHSLPVQFIEEGDPYVDDLKKSIEAIERQTGFRGTLCYQSRSGPVEWLGPSTPETINEMATKGCKNLLVVPISFVSDHIETLYELEIQYRKTAEDLGMRYIVTEALNTDPKFIEGLRRIVLAA